MSRVNRDGITCNVTVLDGNDGPLHGYDSPLGIVDRIDIAAGVAEMALAPFGGHENMHRALQGNNRADQFIIHKTQIYNDSSSVVPSSQGIIRSWRSRDRSGAPCIAGVCEICSPENVGMGTEAAEWIRRSMLALILLTTNFENLKKGTSKVIFPNKALATVSDQCITYISEKDWIES